jgi:hypothetical protein
VTIGKPPLPVKISDLTFTSGNRLKRAVNVKSALTGDTQRRPADDFCLAFEGFP